MSTPTLDLSELIGLSVEQARKVAKGFSLIPRVVSTNGIAMTFSQEYRTDRVNLTINNGNVTKAVIG